VGNLAKAQNAPLASWASARGAVFSGWYTNIDLAPENAVLAGHARPAGEPGAP